MKTLGGILGSLLLLVGAVTVVGADPYEIGDPLLEFDLPADFAYLGRAADDGDLLGATGIDGDDVNSRLVRVDLASGAAQETGTLIPKPQYGADPDPSAAQAVYFHRPAGCTDFACGNLVVVDLSSGEAVQLPAGFRFAAWIYRSTGAPQLYGTTVDAAGRPVSSATFAFDTGFIEQATIPVPWGFQAFGGLDGQVIGESYFDNQLQLRDIATDEVVAVLLEDSSDFDSQNFAASPSLDYLAWGQDESIAILDRTAGDPGILRYIGRELWPTTSISTGRFVPVCGYPFEMELMITDDGDLSGMAGVQPESQGCGSLALDDPPTEIGIDALSIETGGFYFEGNAIDGLTVVNRIGPVAIDWARIPALLRAQSGLSTFHPVAADADGTSVAQFYRDRSDAGSARLTIFAAELLYALDPENPDAPASESLTLYPVIEERKGDGGEVSFEMDPATQHSGGFFRERFFDVTAPTFDGMWVDFDITMYGKSGFNSFGLDIGNGAGEPVTVAVNSRTGETAVLLPNGIWVAETGTAGDVEGPDGDVAIAIQFTGAAEGDDYTVPASEILGQPEFTGMHADPVETSSGNFTHSEFDLLAPGGAPTVAISRTYNSQDPDGGVFGPGWTSWPDVSLQIDGVDHWSSPGLTDTESEATVVVSGRKSKCHDHTRLSSANERWNWPG